jgi:hypothetical protein
MQVARFNLRLSPCIPADCGHTYTAPAPGSTTRSRRRPRSPGTSPGAGPAERAGAAAAVHDRHSGSVTGLQLRVHGITGLRIADASVMPAIPNAPPHVTVLAIAEKAASLIAPACDPAPVHRKGILANGDLPRSSANINHWGLLRSSVLRPQPGSAPRAAFCPQTAHRSTDGVRCLDSVTGRSGLFRDQ